jgi:LysM repeat protein
MPWRLDWRISRHDDDSSQECFRKYYEPAESFNDHALFLTGRSRYASLFNLSKEDYKGGQMVSEERVSHRPQISRRYHILSVMIWDVMMPLLWGKTILHLKSKTQESLLLTVRIDPIWGAKGALYSISKKYNLLVNELKQINNLSANTISIGQRLIVK